MVSHNSIMGASTTLIVLVVITIATTTATKIIMVMPLLVSKILPKNFKKLSIIEQLIEE